MKDQQSNTNTNIGSSNHDMISGVSFEDRGVGSEISHRNLLDDKISYLSSNRP